MIGSGDNFTRVAVVEVDSEYAGNQRKMYNG
jgi:hypothetical protein